MKTPNNSLSGQELKVVIGEIASVTQIYRNGTGHVTGFGGTIYEQLSWLSLRLNFSLDMTISLESFGTLAKNGSWTGMRGQLEREEVDLACAPFTGFVGYDIMELAAYVLGDAYGIFTKYPSPKTSTNGQIKVFSLHVWIGLLISLIACIGCTKLLSFLSWQYSGQPKNSASVGTTFLYFFGVLTNHNMFFRKRSKILGIITVSWLFATFAFVNIYSSCMASYMSLQIQRPDIATLQDVAISGDYLPTTLKAATAEFIFLESKSGKMKQIGDKLRRCTSHCSLTNLTAMIQNVLEDHFVAILPIGIGQFLIHKTMSNRNCRLTMGEESMAFLNMFMGVPKKSPYVMELNKESFWWNSLGLQRYWMRKLMPVPQKCLLKYNNQGESVKFVDRVSLKLEQFYVAFIVLLIGYVLALLQFLRERLVA